MKHIDCKYYLPVDAFKGLCKRDKNNIAADDESCEHFEKAQKCKHCFNFQLTTDDMGNCMKKYDAYPQLNALTCTDFHWN
ncbi:MAG: 4-hydroxyphenylacetate decarboxylase small subunit [Bacteroidetes bacterium]|nr:4-hydroxyphenylacetate decarboxylase small subunit [Bacteroidota bacterium]MBL6943541.1 4-hydroxyphenylacetate decarboxylase small subunit [Bacteroidales bacterium]